MADLEKSKKDKKKDKKMKETSPMDKGMDMKMMAGYKRSMKKLKSRGAKC